MAQLKKVVSVTSGSQTVTCDGDVAAQIQQNFVFMVEGDFVPYFVAANATYNGVTGKTSFTLTGAYQGPTAAAANGVVVVDATYPDLIPTIRQGDVGTATVFTAAMYRLQTLIKAIYDLGLSGVVTAVQTAAATAAAKALEALGYRDEALGFRNTAETYKSDAFGFRNVAEGFKNTAETAKNDAVTAKNAAELAAASYNTIPQLTFSADRALVLTDAGKHLLHPSTDAAIRTVTIPANAAVAFPPSSVITIVNANGAGAVNIAITTDTLRLAGPGTTGARVLAANGIATLLKITATEWIISGAGLS